MTTTLLHPDSPDPIEVEADRVESYKSQGWIVTDGDAEPVKIAPKRRRRPVAKK